MHTPWGEAQSAEVLAPGIVFYSTASHGGIRLSAERQRQLPAGITNWLDTYEWWEEDCDWVVPYLFFARAIREHGTAWKLEDSMKAARSIAAHSHPEIQAIFDA